MNKMEIIKAAFTVWGRKFFRVTSLTELAGELGVTKPALYRHFPSKEALLNAMYEYYLDTYGAYIKPYIEEVLTAGDIVQGLRILIRTMTGFNFRNRYLFIFSLVQRHGDGRACAITGEFRRWGIDMPRLEALEGKGGYPYRLHFALASQAFFVAAQFKKCGGGG